MFLGLYAIFRDDLMERTDGKADAFNTPSTKRGQHYNTYLSLRPMSRTLARDKKCGLRPS